MTSKAERRSRDDKKERVAEVKDFAHFAAAQFFDSGKVDGGE